MNEQQRRFRIKKLWVKARLIMHFQRMKKSANDEAERKLRGDSNQDDEIDLDQLQNQNEQKWKWYIIRTDNTLP